MTASILTNTSAMVALQTLRATNRQLEDVNSQISTGKKVASAKDNAAIFAISKVMESDVSGFKAISESLSLGSSTVAVASNAAKQVGELLNDIKGKIIAASENNVDRQKLQDEVVSLRNQIGGVVGAAQFNGLNLLSNREGAAVTADILANVLGTGSIDILSSLDRASNGTVTTGTIAVAKQDLGTAAAVFGAGSDLAAVAFTGAGAIADGTTGTLTVVGDTATAARAGNAVLAGDSYQITGAAFGLSSDVQYVARDGDTVNDIAKGLAAAFTSQIAADGVTGVSVVQNGAGVEITNNTGASITSAVALASGGTAGGGLESLSGIDITTQNGATAALTDIENLIQTTIDAQAGLGTAEKRVDLQGEFMKSLIDSFKSGIGTLVDADLEAASARLQALQVQQQLGVQALSIANQAPQNILALFR